MTDVDPYTNLAGVLSEVHDIFKENAVEKDLNAIKRTKKICADTKQIMMNRELEIKEVVRALQSSVEEKEEASENDSAVRECLRQIKDAEVNKLRLNEQMHTLSKDKESSARDLERVRTELEQLEDEKEKVEAQLRSTIPVQMGMMALYVNVTNIRFDYDAANVKGLVVPAESENVEPRPFDLDPSAMSQFDLCNQLWDIID